MKILKRVKLINWHSFPDETIEFGRAVMFSGDNGVGKSTVLDAIQFAITCSKANFNKAAQDKGKRTLNGYVRFKTGTENREYERTGEISAHICLEFYDEERKQYFLVGVVMDSPSEEREPNTAWYLMEDRQFSDDLFLNGKNVKGIQAFRTNKGIRKWAPTIGEARAMILSRFGRLNEKFFSLIPKAMAFKPIHDIKEFVYSYVLDEREVNIDTLRENVRSYQELERMLEDVRRRIAELEVIRDKEADVERCIKLDRSYEYYIARAQQEIITVQIDQTLEAIKSARQRIAQITLLYNDKEDTKRAREEMMQALRAELDNNEEYRALHEFERREEELASAIKRDKHDVEELKASVRKALRTGEDLVGAAVSEGIIESGGRAETAGSAGASAAQTQGTEAGNVSSQSTAAFTSYLKKLEVIETYEYLSEISADADAAAEYRKSVWQSANTQLAQESLTLNQKKTELGEIRHKVEELQAHRFIYPKGVNELRQRIQEELLKLGKRSEARVLCELLEISLPAWQDAVEGYLNTQRFYILVEPEDYDVAVSVYDKLREAKKVYGVGLINTAKLEQYEEVPKDSLAEAVSSKNIWARRYINMVLGKVQRCNSYRELKNYPTAITRQCMRYQNHVVSAIKPEVYETPYIGAEAIKRQLLAAQAQQKELEELCESLKARLAGLNTLLTYADSSCDIEVKNRLRYLEQLRLHTNELKDCREQIRKLKKNETLIQKSIQLDEIKADLKRISDEITVLIEERGRKNEAVSRDEEKHSQLCGELEAQKSYTEKLAEELWEEYNDAESEYQKIKKEKDPYKFKENYERARKANQTVREKSESEMVKAMQVYKSAHDFGAPDSLLGYPEYAAEYDKLKNSRLLEYEEKVYRARNAAEEEFREQFLSKLSENIRQARQDFKELNRALSEISFDKEHYEFLYEPRSSMKKYYTMIMDDRNIGGSDTIFGMDFMNTHREVIDELFSKLALGDDESTDKVLEQYTDYRTYMDYDIKITMPDGSYMLYSKVSSEKSGGETQSPFYITVAASFIQLYKNSIGGDAIGIMMMDEAFNNMDDTRMGSVLEFMTNPEMKLQLIIAAPPGKIQDIGKYMDKIQLIMPDGKYRFIYDYTDENVR